jgi:vacuolar-type H+-ATPase subunit E/Vma4
MSLDAILTSILASGEQRVGEIEAQGRVAPLEILEKSRLENDRLREITRQEAIRPAFKEQARILHRARLEAMQVIGEVRKNLVDTALDRIADELSRTRSGPSYPKILHRLVEEALVELEDSFTESQGCRLQADPQDNQLLQAILDDLGNDLPVSCNLNCWGGVIATSRDGRVTVINTIESRFERATLYLRQYLTTLLEQDRIVETPKSMLSTQPL